MVYPLHIFYYTYVFFHEMLVKLCEPKTLKKYHTSNNSHERDIKVLANVIFLSFVYKTFTKLIRNGMFY